MLLKQKLTSQTQIAEIKPEIDSIVLAALIPNYGNFLGHSRRSYNFKLLGQNLISDSKNWVQQGFTGNVVKRTLQLLKWLRLCALMSSEVQFPTNILRARC